MTILDDAEDYELSDTLRLQPRQISSQTFSKFEGYIAEIFSAYGLDLNSPPQKIHPVDLSKPCLMPRMVMMVILNY